MNFIDLADFYSTGVGEEVVGRILKRLVKREEIVVTTKVGYDMASHANAGGHSRKHIMDGIDASLKRLDMDYVDVYMLHFFDVNTPVEETMCALDDIVRAGKARYIGVSTMYTWQFAKIMQACERHGWHKPVNMQLQLNLAYREEEREMIPYCIDQGVGVSVFSPLARGLLTCDAKSNAQSDRLLHRANVRRPCLARNLGVGGARGGAARRIGGADRAGVGAEPSGHREHAGRRGLGCAVRQRARRARHDASTPTNCTSWSATTRRAISSTTTRRDGASRARRVPRKACSTTHWSAQHERLCCRRITTSTASGARARAPMPCAIRRRAKSSRTSRAAAARKPRQAIDAAKRAFPAWRALTAKERGARVKRWGELMLANRDTLAELLTREQGKPLAEALGEVAYAASFFEWFAEEAKRSYGDVIPSPKPNSKIIVTREPVGVVAAITPWNFPLAMITRKAGPALAAGCTMVLKPSEETPLSAFALGVLAEEAGIPPGVFNIVSGDAVAIGEALTESRDVRKLSFTGSTRVGKLLAKQSADTLKKLSLELGGNAPFIVFDDADIDAAVQGAIASKFRNTGQTCVCVNRFYVQDGVYDAFTQALTRAVHKLRVGNGLRRRVRSGSAHQRGGAEEGADACRRCREPKARRF